MNWLIVGGALVGAAAASLRWLRVAQREHYLPGVTHFARVWWAVDAANVALLIGGVAAAALTALVPAVGVVPALVAVIAPIGLGLRGRTSPLAWTSRLRRLAGVVAVLVVCVVGAGVAAEALVVVALVPLALPLLVDLALVLIRPYERRQGERWVSTAAETLRRLDPVIVAITGSYGKTTAKNLVAHLLAPVKSVVASPASFNNRMGLARAINEQLVAGTEVFVAEMGTYGPGEIAELCSWIPPDVAVITALGPVHLERMGSIENIARAKSEILDSAPVVVVSVDHPLLAGIAAEEMSRRRVITVSGQHRDDAEVTAAADGVVRLHGTEVGRFPPHAAHPVNVAAAMGVCLGLGIDLAAVTERLTSLPSVPHRRVVGRSERGFDIIDDTFNSNPAGAASALELLAGLGTPTGRRVVVTPGMVELGSEQEEANRAFAEAAGGHGVTDLIIVNRTNRRALEVGARAGGVGNVILAENRDDAVRWVREHLGPGDAVLYENDLPDHYP